MRLYAVDILGAMQAFTADVRFLNSTEFVRILRLDMNPAESKIGDARLESNFSAY